jgi:hypothetical protein
VVVLLCLCVSPKVAGQWLSKRVSTATNSDATIELLDLSFICGPCHIKYSVCIERKVGD